MHIQITRYPNMEYSISSSQDNYQKSVVNNTDFEYYFEESEEDILHFGFEMQESYYLFTVLSYKEKSNQEFVEVMYQYINTL